MLQATWYWLPLNRPSLRFSWDETKRILLETRRTRSTIWYRQVIMESSCKQWLSVMRTPVVEVSKVKVPSSQLTSMFKTAVEIETMEWPIQSRSIALHLLLVTTEGGLIGRFFTSNLPWVTATQCSMMDFHLTPSLAVTTIAKKTKTTPSRRT